MIAFLGGVVHRLVSVVQVMLALGFHSRRQVHNHSLDVQVPNVLSFSDFVRRRFGTTVMLYISALTLFNMGEGHVL